MDTSLTVKPADSIGQYYVDSATDGDPHVVDMLENNGKGACSCGQYVYRVNPAWRLGKEFPPCKHVLACNQWAGTQYHLQLVKNINK
jgi:predicted nucleic acid-binding Zn finger protein